jgi:hypothetical protein
MPSYDFPFGKPYMGSGHSLRVAPDACFIVMAHLTSMTLLIAFSL